MLKLGLACAAALALCTTFADAATYQFNVNTSSLAGTSGYVEFQMGNNGLAIVQAIATISNFQGGGGTLSGDPYTSVDLFGTPDVLGNVSGTLSNALVLNDDGSTTVADFLQPFTFGNSLSFWVALSGPALDTSTCLGNCVHTFGLGILDAAENYQFVADPLGNAFLLGGLNVDGNGNVSQYLNASADGGPSALTITAAQVPEPATWAVLLLGLFGVGFLVRGARRRDAIAPA